MRDQSTGFRNRLVVLTKWAMPYWTNRRAARVMTAEPNDPALR